MVMKFEALSENSVKDREQQISDYWKEIDLLNNQLKLEKKVLVMYFLMDHQQLMVSLVYTML